jgi:plastocyanin
MLTRRVSWIAFSVMVSLVALTSACGRASNPTPQPSNPNPLGPGIDATVRIKGNLGGSSYVPSPLQVRVGQTVNWLNEDSIEHTATLEGAFDTGRISPTSAHSENGDQVTFRTAGTFTYHCTIHPCMVGTIVVQ